MKVAFYAPLKAPDHPVPSGDRQLARALVQALRAGGHDVAIASRFRSFDGPGDPARQARLRDLGSRLAHRLVARYRRARVGPDVWFSYHLYHKAPDWIGPPVSRALGIPYVVAEASVAAKQRAGPWALGYAGALAALGVADAAVFLNPVDVAGVREARGARSADVLLPPFLDLAAFAGGNLPSPKAPRPPGAPVRLIAVAMMRPGAKLASYQLLAAALARIAAPAWELSIVGDGPARAEVEAAFAPIASRRVHFAGALPAERVAALLRESDLFVWPAIDEAFGMAFVEAQACGCPVIAGNSGGVGAVVVAGRSGILVPAGDVDAFAAATERLLADAKARTRMGREAAAYVRERHDLPAAAERIDALLREVVARRAGAGDGDGIAATGR